MEKKQKKYFLGISSLLGISTIICVGSFLIIKNNQKNEVYLEKDNSAYYSTPNTNDKILRLFSGKVLTATDVASLGWNTATRITQTDWINQAPNVIEIGGSAFSRQTRLENIFIPKTILKIGDNAFDNTSGMKTIVFEASSQLQTIGNLCFGSSAITSIDFPDSLTTIGQQAFQYTSSLHSVTFGANSSLTVIEPWVFQYSGIRSIVIPNSLTGIKIGAFEFAQNLTTVVISENSNLKYISTNTFKDTAITSIYIPNSLTQLSNNSFLNTSFLLGKNISIPITWKKDSLTPLYGFTQAQWNSINWRPVQFTGTTLTAKNVEDLGWSTKTTITLEDWNVWAPNVKEIGAATFKDKLTLILIEIPDSITTISEGAFQGTASLKTATISSNSKLTSIGNLAFNNSGITAINIPDQVKTIGEYAFKVTPSLTTVTIGVNSQLTTIGIWAFHESNLTSIHIPNLVVALNRGVFFDASKLETITFGTSSKLATIEDAAFMNCISLTAIYVPDSVTSIGETSFQQTTSLLGENVSIRITFENNSPTPLYGFIQAQWDTIKWRRDLTEPFTGEILNLETVISLGWNTKTLISLADWREWAPNVTNIQGAFEGVITLESIEIPAKITTLSSFSFANTQALKLIRFASGSQLAFIGDSVFQDSGIISISIPESVTSIGENAFLNTNSLTDIEMYIKFKEDIWISNYGFTENQMEKIKWIGESIWDNPANIAVLSAGFGIIVIVLICDLFVLSKLRKM